MLADAPLNLDADEARKWVSAIAGKEIAIRLSELFDRYGFCERSQDA